MLELKHGNVSYYAVDDNVSSLLRPQKFALTAGEFALYGAFLKRVYVGIWKIIVQLFVKAPFAYELRASSLHVRPLALFFLLAALFLIVGLIRTL